MDYGEALAYLEGLINYETQPRAGRTEALSLHNIRALTELCGSPQHSYPVIHITGTNGKGSTARMIEALMAGMGLKVGLYTSPHLASPCERIRVACEDIDESAFGEVVGYVRHLSEVAKLDRPTWFETVTAGAFWHLANEAVDVAVVEVGMLGRFDATNVADGQIAVITNVGLDHSDGLAGWWQRIAHEKAGIVKAGATAILGEPTSELVNIVAREAPAKLIVPKGPLVEPIVGGADDSRRPDNYSNIELQEFGMEANEVAVGGRLLNIEGVRATYDNVFLSLHGSHQGHNCAVALAAAEEFFEAPVPADVVEEAFGSLGVPGRLEVVGRSPLVLLDAAHNKPAAQALAQAIQEDFAGIGQRHLVFGAQDGRNPAEVLEALSASSFDSVVVCTAPTARGIPAGVLRETLATMRVECEAIADVEGALAYALGQASEEDVVVVAGSVTVLEAARNFSAAN